MNSFTDKFMPLYSTLRSSEYDFILQNSRTNDILYNKKIFYTQTNQHENQFVSINSAISVNFQKILIKGPWQNQPQADCVLSNLDYQTQTLDGMYIT